MSRGKHKAIPVGPGGVLGMMFQEARPKDGRHIGRAQGQARMARICGLNGIYSQ